MFICLQNTKYQIIQNQSSLIGAIEGLSNAFSWEFDPHPPPRNANNVEPYTFVMLFSGKADTPPRQPPTPLRTDWQTHWKDPEQNAFHDYLA